MATASRNPIEEDVNKNKVMKNHERIPKESRKISKLVNQNRSKIVPGMKRCWKIAENGNSFQKSH